MAIRSAALAVTSVVAAVLVIGAVALRDSFLRPPNRPLPDARGGLAASTFEPYATFFHRTRTWPQFLDAVRMQRDLWIRNAAGAHADDSLVERLVRAGSGLTFLVIAEDWCIDSANTVPSIARLADAARIPLRILDRSDGQPVMDRHRTPDGRAVTPTVVLLRDGRDAGAWVERPAPLQRMFRAMAGDDSLRRQFERRQAWYDEDRGRTTLAEIVALAEETAVRR